jgi:Flp pilus assembly protein TadD
MNAIKSNQIVLAILVLVSIIIAVPCYGAETAEDLFKKGKDLSLDNKFEQAIQNYNQAIKLDPKMVKAYNNRGVAYMNGKQYDLAIADFTKVIELDPKHGKAYNNRAIAYWCKEDKEKARQDVKKAEGLGIKVNPDFIKKIEDQPKPTQ